MPFRVVSTIPLPVVDGFAGLGNGAVVTLSGLRGRGMPRQSRPGPVPADGGGDKPRFHPDQVVRQARRVSRPSLISLTLSSPSPCSPITPTSLINFGEAVDFPLIFGAIVAVFGAATLLHLLVVSVSRRRRETGLLKVLGFVNSQVVWAVSSQATTLAVVGIIIGVPIGFDRRTGRPGTSSPATSVSSRSSVVPVWLIAVLAVGVIVVANVLAVGPALAATRSKAGKLLEAP